MTKTLIVIPVYNEERTLGRVLAEVRGHAPSADILVVDDGSTDGSPRILVGGTWRKLLPKSLPHAEVHVIRHATNQGYGQSLISGFAFAIKHDYDVVVTIDCDEQHEPARIPDFLHALSAADIVSGSRYLDPTMPGDPPPADRHQLNAEFTEYLRAITGYALTDAWCGFKAYRVTALRKLQLTEPSYGMPLQVWVQAAYHRLRVTELAVARIYKNPNRKFWGGLDDVQTRRAYYLRVLEAEVAQWLPDRVSLLRVPR